MKTRPDKCACRSRYCLRCTPGGPQSKPVRARAPRTDRHCRMRKLNQIKNLLGIKVAAAERRARTLDQLKNLLAVKVADAVIDDKDLRELTEALGDDSADKETPLEQLAAKMLAPNEQRK